MTELELLVDEGRAPLAAHLFRAGNELLALLDELSDEPVDWLITHLRVGSSVARVGAPPESDAGRASLKRVVKGLTSVRDGHGLPGDWNPDAVSAARRLASRDDDLVDRQDLGPRLTLIEGELRREQVELSDDLASRLAELQPAERTMPGAVRGRVVGINVARGNRGSLRSQSGRLVKLTFADDLRLRLREALYDDVEVIGQVRQDEAGHSFHVRVESMRPLKTPTVRWTDLFGIDPDFTGGRSVAEYLEATRGTA